MAWNSSSGLLANYGNNDYGYGDYGFMGLSGNNASNTGTSLNYNTGNPLSGVKTSFQNQPNGLATSGAAGAVPTWASNLGAGAQVVQSLAGLAQAYTGYKQLGLAKDMFGFEKSATNRNIANQGQLINNDLERRTKVGLALAGNSLSPEQAAQRMADMERSKVNTSPI